MNPETLAIAVVAIIPTTIASLAAWRSARKASHQTNGMLHEPLQRIEEKIDDLAKWQASHLDRWHTN